MKIFSISFKFLDSRAYFAFVMEFLFRDQSILKDFLSLQNYFSNLLPSYKTFLVKLPILNTIPILEILSQKFPPAKLLPMRMKIFLIRRI